MFVCTCMHCSLLSIFVNDTTSFNRRQMERKKTYGFVCVCGFGCFWLGWGFLGGGGAGGGGVLCLKVLVSNHRLHRVDWAVCELQQSQPLPNKVLGFLLQASSQKHSLLHCYSLQRKYTALMVTFLPKNEWKMVWGYFVRNTFFFFFSRGRI